MPEKSPLETARSFVPIALGFAVLFAALAYGQPRHKPGPPPSVQAPNEAPDDPLVPPAIAAARQAVVYIRVTGPREGLRVHGWQGSGFLACVEGTRGFIVTNKHVAYAPDARKIEVVFHAGTGAQRWITAKPLGHHASLDLAILEIEASGLPEPLVCSEVTIPDAQLPMKAATIGFPGGSRGMTPLPRATVGRGALTRFYGGSQYVFQDLGTYAGASGSPVLDPFGEAIAVVHGGVNNITLAVTSQEVLRFLKSKGLHPPGR
ncbi:MAG: serine protease [Planctomycetota bacterium]|nr:serine protease [Planctomycetota bacterium]